MTNLKHLTDEPGGALKNELKKLIGREGSHQHPIFKALDDLYSQTGEIELLSSLGETELNYPKMIKLFSTINRHSKELMNGHRALEFIIKKYLPKEAMPSQAN